MQMTITNIPFSAMTTTQVPNTAHLPNTVPAIQVPEVQVVQAALVVPVAQVVQAALADLLLVALHLEVPPQLTTVEVLLLVAVPAVEALHQEDLVPEVHLVALLLVAVPAVEALLVALHQEDLAEEQLSC